MKSYLNGKELTNWDDFEDMKLPLNNSAFLWGESVFTTGRLEEGKLQFWEAHLVRIEKAYKWLTNENLNKEELQNEVFNIVSHLRESKPLRFRLTYFFDSWSQPCRLLTFSPFTQKNDCELVSTQIPYVSLRSQNLKVGQYADINVLKRKLKSELCLISKAGEVLESSSSNLIFLNGHDEWETPQSEDFILEGIGLHHGLKTLKIQRRTILKKELKSKKAAFTVNAVHGPVPITRIDDITFTESKNYLTHLKNHWGAE